MYHRLFLFIVLPDTRAGFYESIPTVSPHVLTPAPPFSWGPQSVFPIVSKALPHCNLSRANRNAPHPDLRKIGSHTAIDKQDRAWLNSHPTKCVLFGSCLAVAETKFSFRIVLSSIAHEVRRYFICKLWPWESYKFGVKNIFHSCFPPCRNNVE